MADDGELGRALSRITFRDCLALAKRGGARTHGKDRFTCLAPGCANPNSGHDVGCHMGSRVDGHQVVRMQCFKCGWKGTYIDLLCLVDGIDEKEACRELLGDARIERRNAVRRTAVAAPIPQQQAVAAEGKLKPKEVADAWAGTSTDDAAGRAYLASRRLSADGLVRFVNEDHSNRGLARRAAQGYRVAMLCKDVLGQPTGMQIRRVGEYDDGESKMVSMTGSRLTWFGRPEQIATVGMVAVTEGMADTLAVSGWIDACGKAEDAAIVGAPGKNRIPALAKDLKDAGIDVAGKCFALFVQNDVGNMSRIEFAKLRTALERMGAHVQMANTPHAYEDVADRLAAEGLPDEAPIVPMGDPGDVDTEHKSMSALRDMLADDTIRAAVLGRKATLRQNRMTGHVELGGKPLTDNDLTRMRIGLERYTVGHVGKRFSWAAGDIQQAVDLVADDAGYHPVADWLATLRWDGVARIEAGFATALGVSDPLHKTLLRRWLIGACARARSPGCKLDTVLILMGRQGVGKSTLFSVLAGREWFCDSPIDIGSRDGTMVLRSAWIVEWPELDSMRRARDQEMIKAFLSRRVDAYRAPYARTVVDIPRSCVIVGTTNDTDIIGDVTGSRRFWVVPVDRVDVAWVEKNREQVWAEAHALYDGGESHWLTAEEDERLADSNSDYETVNGDPWYGKLADYCRGKDTVYLDDILESLDVETARRSHGDSIRIGRIMRRLGWDRIRVGTRADRRRGWCWGGARGFDGTAGQQEVPF